MIHKPVIRHFYLLLVLFGGYMSSGCTSQQSIANVVRTGDTVVVSLGSMHRGALVPIIKKENLTVTITDSSSSVYSAKLRYVFRVFPDPTSAYASRSIKSSFAVGYANYVDPHDGIWMAVIDLIDPSSTWQAPTALPLATGPATINISSPELQSFVDFSGYGWTWTNGNLNSISVEIIAGTGAPNPLNYMQPISTAPMANLEPNPQVVVRANGTPATPVGGAELVFSYVTADFTGGLPRVVPTTPDTRLHIASHHIDQQDGTSLLRVVITNPHGIAVDNSKVMQPMGRSLLRSLNFAIVWDDTLIAGTIDDSNWQNSIQLVSSEYFDLSGLTMTELSATLTKAR